MIDILAWLVFLGSFVTFEIFVLLVNRKEKRKHEKGNQNGN